MCSLKESQVEGETAVGSWPKRVGHRTEGVIRLRRKADPWMSVTPGQAISSANVSLPGVARPNWESMSCWPLDGWSSVNRRRPCGREVDYPHAETSGGASIGFRRVVKARGLL